MSGAAAAGAWIGRLWPSSALAVWALSALLAQAAGWGAGCLLALGLALLHRRPWRRLVVALGLPAALLLQGVALPAWAWLLPLALLLLLYPRRLWSDAPLFLTPPSTFDALPPLLPLAPGARVLDGGSGSGAALRALHRAYPQARLHGIEASRMLLLWSRWRCPWAQLRQGDFWAEDWSGYALVYLFQRPESMPRAAVKARAELQPGSWLLSLDFELPGIRPRWQLPVGRHRLLGYVAEDLN